MNELEELEQEELDAKMLEAPTPAMSVPNVPSHEPGSYQYYVVCIGELSLNI